MIAVDWGISTFRAYKVDKEGAIKDRLETPLALLKVAPGTFPQTFETQVGPWLATNKGPIMLSGMVGSRHGWSEIPYVAAPAGIRELASGAREVTWGSHRAWIVPGISGCDETGVADVMRGEEAQLVGVFDRLPDRALVCLPGTHSKWVRIEGRRIISFSTHMTGEVFAVLKDHSILGRTMTDAPTDAAAFADGVARASAMGGMLHHLFGIRARGLAGSLPAPVAASYLSGLLIGHELSSITGDEPIFLLGSTHLVELYRSALEGLGRTVQVLDPDAVAHGLYAIAREMTKQ